MKAKPSLIGRLFARARNKYSLCVYDLTSRRLRIIWSWIRLTKL